MKQVANERCAASAVAQRDREPISHAKAAVAAPPSCYAQLWREHGRRTKRHSSGRSGASSWRR